MGSHGQGAAVLVAKPARNGRNIHARLDAARREKMPQIVVSDSLHADDVGRAVHGTLTFEHSPNRSFQVGVRAFRSESFKQSSHL